MLTGVPALTSRQPPWGGSLYSPVPVVVRVAIMARSYVGIISPRGLESLLPETEHAVPFLVRRAYGRRSGEAVCYWAVMPDSTARQVETQLEARFHEDAFLVTVHGIRN